jgi:catechol 2,3-dioxygenase-like lactoylglutathione lyase family enzyme
MADATAHITEIRTVGVPVSDHDRALDFYIGKLGFEKRLDAEFDPGDGNRLRWVEVAPPGAATSIALMPAHEGAPAGVDTGIRLTTTDTDGDHAAMRAAGIDVDEEVLRWTDVPPMFTFRDPDGNTLYLVEPMD